MKKGITNEQSKILQGLAILMMLYHHLFSVPEALGVPFRSLLVFDTVNIQQKAAFFFKICVGIYAFVTGYGLCRLLEKNDTGSSLQRLFSRYRMILKKLAGFYVRFLLVFLLFVPVGFWFFGKPFDGNTFLFSLTGLSAAYNGAWWYISLYYKMLFTAPVVYGILTGSYLCIGLAVAGFAVLRFLPVPSGRLLEPVVASFHPAFYLCFLMGFLLARFRIYELVGRLPLVLVRVLGVLLFFLMIADRVRLAVDASSAGMDYVFVPLFSFGFLQILGMLPAVCNRVFSFFGKYSTYIWLTHVFFYDHYTKPLVTASRVSAGIYLTLVVLSTLAALGLSRIESFLCDHCLTL